MILSIFWTNRGKQSSKNAPIHTTQRSYEKGNGSEKKNYDSEKKGDGSSKKDYYFFKSGRFSFYLLNWKRIGSVNHTATGSPC